MKSVFLAAALTLATLPSHAADVAVSISVGQPGFYGQIDIGGYPQPRVLYREPVLIERVAVHHAPVYLRVPPGHAKNWGKHCHAYNACGERVYFVQDDWYQNEYVPRYQKSHPGKGKSNKQGGGHGNQYGKGSGY